MEKTEDYFQTLIRAMDMLAENDNTIFIGQSCVWDGHALFKTLKNVPMEKRIEMPVIEDSQMGFSIGMSIMGYVPISIYPRWDFLLLAANQMINHLDKLPLVSHNMIPTKVIIRVAVGSRVPLDPGPQHYQDYTKAFKSMCNTIEIIDIGHKNEILPAYSKALHRTDGYSTLLVEHSDLYHRES